MRPTDPAVRQQLAPARRELAVVLVAGGVGSLLLVGQAWAVTELVLAALDDGAVWPWALVVVGVFAARSAVGWTTDTMAARAAAVVGSDVRRRVVGAILRDGGAGRSTGELATLATRGATAAEPYLTRYVPALALAGVLPVVTLLAIATQDPMSALIVLVTLPLIPVFGILVGLATRDRARLQWRAFESLSGHFLDVMRGLPTLVAFRRAEAQSSTIRSITERYRRRTVHTLQVAFASSAVLELVATLSVALVAVTVGIRLSHGDLDLETALVVLLLAPEAYWPLRRVGAEFHAAAEGVATFEAASELVDADDPTPHRRPGSMRLEHVSVLRPGRAVPALDDVSVAVPDRGVLAITGPSGCGKSTLLAVLAGLLEPTSGTVHGPTRDRIAWLPQRPVFVAGTVADNLRLAAPDADDDRLRSALAAVALPVGLDTVLGEDGTTLSAGERARLALARVVLAERPYVLLDEPTAHLDTDTERVIVETVRELGRRSAVVVVAHRPALVAVADRVVTLPVPTAVLPVRAASVAARPTPPEEPADGRRHGLVLPTVLGGLASASGVALTATAGWLIVKASYEPAILTLLVAIVAVRTFGIARPVLRYAERLRSHDVVLRMLADRRVAVYDAVVPLTPGALGRRRGDVLAAVVDDVDAVMDRELRVRMPVSGFVITAAIAVAFAAFAAPVVVPVLLGLCAAAAAAFVLARTGAARAERAAVDTRARLSDAVVEATQTAGELAMWQAEGRTLDAVSALSDRLGRRTVAAATWLASGRALVLACSGLAVAASALLLPGVVGGPMLALLVLLPLALGEVASSLADAGALAARTRAAEDRLAALASRVPAVAPPVAPVAPAGADLEVDGVSAAWDDRVVLESLSLTLAPGDRVAVVGPTGSGKSTLAALLLRFVDPVRGGVRLGGRPLPEIALDDVRRTVGLVDDDPHVFATTLVENVRLARPAATDAEVDAALRAARLGEWLDSLPDGLDSWLGDGHAQVSGGERARIAIARSLLADQPVLVLDEPAAHLDGATADELAAEVLGGDRARTVVWITHADAGLDRVDRVVSLG
ncbi:ABC transporter permease [Nocardioides sp. Root1257]|uniref:thiol reductant ABC exporter subunit CydD n=1 Tax=unclassified Nocardioides TaxID=2615069 RepID=UPI0006FA8463|nr:MULTISPECIES: thiol reductant ABC exporter subunit CydD [unclassified Nocardioides]KQW48889.1 ABC transporter permease [Nocardioides sp. Root1257]KRC48064.1 ABC transporter permease [Nocardioides sp. Root224]